jgi:hypothetical protein
VELFVGNAEAFVEATAFVLALAALFVALLEIEASFVLLAL